MYTEPVLRLLVAKLVRLVLVIKGDSKYDGTGLFLVTWDLVFMLD